MLCVVKEARRAGKKVGLLRLITAWPFPSKEIEQLGETVKAMLVPEINYGQMDHVVREYAECPVISVPYAPGSLFPPERIYEALEKL